MAALKQHAFAQETIINQVNNYASAFAIWTLQIYEVSQISLKLQIPKDMPTEVESSV